MMLDEPRGGPAAPAASFYCVADQHYFLGAVGLVNSLRILGHDEPIVLLDCGLTAAQRELLAPQATLLPAPDETPPWLLKTVAPLRRPARVMVLLDADIVVTRNLGALVEIASDGEIVAFRDHQEDRFFADWGELLGLGAARPGPYVSSALVVLGGDPGGEVLRLLDASQDRVDFERTLWRRNDRDYQFLYADQDVLNAILATRVGAEQVVTLEPRLAPTPPFDGLRLRDARTLACAYADGREPYAVHHSLSPKPWQRPAYEGVYSRLLRRLLTAPDVAIRVPRGEIPLTLRPGPVAYAERQRVKAREQLGWRVGGFLRERLGVGSAERGRVT